MKHCWHEKIKAGTGLIKLYGVEVCCFCGLEHNPYALIPAKTTEALIQIKFHRLNLMENVSGKGDKP